MKSLHLLLISSLLLFLVVVDASDLAERFTRGRKSVQSVDGDTRCRRTITKRVTNSDIRIDSTRACKRDSTRSASHLVFDINTNGRPDIKINFFNRIADAETGDSSAAWKGFRVWFQRVVEYREVNGVAGYQPGRNNLTDDYPGNIDFLGSKSWQPITETQETLEGGAVVHTFTAKSTDNVVEFGFHFTTDYIEGENSTRLVPHSGKFTFAVNNYVYSDPQAEGLALRVFVIARGGVRNKTKADSDTELNLTYKSGVNVGNEQGDYENSFFTWDDFVTDSDGNRVTVYNHQLSLDSERSDVTGLVDAQLHATTIWFSIPGRPTTFEWDPEVGIVDPNSSSTTIFASLLLLCVCILASVL
jgi:hypothetical protein